MGAFAVLDGFWIVATGTVLVGVGSGLMSPIFLILMTEEVRESVRGRVLGLFDAVDPRRRSGGPGAARVAC